MTELKNPMPMQTPTRKQIAARARQICLERGGGPGHESDDWLQAEYELMHLPILKLAELEPPKAGHHQRMAKSIISLVHAALL